MARSRFTDRDRGYRELMQVMRSPTHDIVVGIVGDEAAKIHDDAQIPVGELAAIHEFGSADIPARPFMRFGFDKRRRQYAKSMNRILATTNNRGQLGPKFVKLGREIAEQIRNDVRSDSLRLARLAPQTVAKKGHGTPLLDTGELTAAITARVVRRDR